jgi:transcriptional regulator with XRE-family HTH domain
MSRDELCSRLGLDRSALLRLEAGHAPLTADIAGRLASLTKVPVGFLLDGWPAVVGTGNCRERREVG